MQREDKRYTAPVLSVREHARRAQVSPSQTQAGARGHTSAMCRGKSNNCCGRATQGWPFQRSSTRTQLTSPIWAHIFARLASLCTLRADACNTRPHMLYCRASVRKLRMLARSDGRWFQVTCKHTLNPASQMRD